jgi:isohexenylglutaconyl-CoA hydratase
MSLPDTQNLVLEHVDGVLHVTFDRPEVSNALNTATVDELAATFAAVRDDRSVRAVVLRGKGRHFCAGADLKSVGREAGSDHRVGVIEFNRRFGEVLDMINSAPQPVVVVAQGAALGGGFGLLCVSDVAIVTRDAKMGMPETRLGLPPAQILPFVVERIGVTQARRIALCGLRFDGAEAHRIGVAHELADDMPVAEEMLEGVLADIRACAPGANAVTKQIIGSLDARPMERLIEQAAEHFADCLLGDEGREGTQAFNDKRKPQWAAS